jgi:hypothetical protein
VLFTKDGRVFSGLLVKQTPEAYVLDIAGVETTFQATLIERVRLLAPVLERYKEMRDAVPADDVERRAELVVWLADRRQLELALLEAEVLLARNPKSVSAKRLYEQIKTKAALVKPVERVPGGGPGGQREGPEGPAIRAIDFPLLNEKQINLIKVFEVDLAQNPRVIVPQAVVRDLIEQYSSSPLIPATRSGREELVRRPGVELLNLIYRLRAREFYDRVQILDHPESLRRFRDEVQRTYVLNACATSGCHGGTEAGRLQLATFRANSDQAVYTNFYILQQYRTDTGEPLLNLDQPERSLLVQYGLPRELARSRHPAVLLDGKDQWKAGLSGPDDRRLKATVEWIKGLYRPRPEYEMEYEPVRPFVAPPKVPAPDGPGGVGPGTGAPVER